MSSVRLSTSVMPMPPVSVNSKNRPSASTTVSSRSRVTPAVGSTMAMRRPASQLNSDDLPTLGRPTMATLGIGMGDSEKRKTSTAGGGQRQSLYGVVGDAREN